MPKDGATSTSPAIRTRRPGRCKTDPPNPIDVHVGSRMRLRRTLLGMSQVKLGEAIGLTFQQVQKYERGANRIGASRLFDLSQVLDVPVSFFFDAMALDTSGGSPSLGELSPGGMGEERQAVFEPDFMAKRETLSLVRAYYAIPDARVRRQAYEVVRALSKSGEH